MMPLMTLLLQGGVRTGLNKLFYSIYSRNADEALVALKMMGVFVPTGDDTAVKRTAQFFLNSFYERLETQTDEREVKGEEYSKEFKAQRSKVRFVIVCAWTDAKIFGNI